MFAKLAVWGDSSKAMSIASIEPTLKAFNAIHEEEGNGTTTEERQGGYPQKIKHLQLALNSLGYTGIDTTTSNQNGFQSRQAADNRRNYLHDKDGRALDQKLYQGTILPR